MGAVAQGSSCDDDPEPQILQLGDLAMLTTANIRGNKVSTWQDLHSCLPVEDVRRLHAEKGRIVYQPEVLIPHQG
jgi:hypothetical protein